MRNPIVRYDRFIEAFHENEADSLKAYPVLVLCDDAACADRVAQAVRKRGLEVICCSRVSDARFLLSVRRFSLVFSSESLPDGEVRSVIGVAGTIPVVIFSQRAEWDTYLDALNHGAFDYINCPLDSAETERILELALSESSR